MHQVTKPILNAQNSLKDSIGRFGWVRSFFNSILCINKAQAGRLEVHFFVSLLMHLLEGPDLLSYGEVRKERKGKKKKKAQHPRSLEFLAPKV